VCRGLDLLVDVEDAAVDADVERPPRREWLILVDDAVGGGGRFRRIAQQRVIDAERLRECPVRLGRIDADGEVCDVEGTDFVATLTE
jgi:hypothetical protein